MNKGKEVVANFPKIFKPLDQPHRYKMIHGGRGKGASWTVGRKLLIRGTEKPLRILCTRELQKSIKQSVHRLLSDQIDRLSLRGFYDVQQQGIYGKNGTEIFFIGVKANPEEIKSMEGLDIVWIEEAHSLSESSWDIIDPTIRKDGSEIWATWNDRFKFDHMQQMFVVNTPPPDSLVLKVNYYDNPYFPEVLKKQMLHMKEVDYEKYLHVWEGELRQLAEGAVFGNQITQIKRENRLLSIPVISNCEVDVFADIGKSDQTALWFMQRVGREYRFIDYYENRLQDVDHYVKVIKMLGYNYGTFYFPHDADHDRLGMKHNIREQFENSGIKPLRIVPRCKEKHVAIERARSMLAECWFHKGDYSGNELEFVDDSMRTRGQRAEKGFDGLSNYRYKYNEDDDVYQKAPHHDWTSNTADAFMQFAQDYLDETVIQGNGGAIQMNNTFKVF